MPVAVGDEVATVAKLDGKLGVCEAEVRVRRRLSYFDGCRMWRRGSVMGENLSALAAVVGDPYNGWRAVVLGKLDGVGGRDWWAVIVGKLVGVGGHALGRRGRVPWGKDLSVLMSSRDSDRLSPENSGDEGGSEMRLSGPNSLDLPKTHIHHDRLELENSHEKNLKRSREVDNGAPHNVLGDGHLFVDGVNRRDRAGSFWDMSDKDLGWSMGKTIIGDHDILHLLPQPTESLTHALAWNAFQVLSLASTFQLREERSRNGESKLHEEIAMLRKELFKKQKVSDEKSKSCETLRVELEEKLKSYYVLRQELQQLEEKYSVELTTGENFLNSSLGKTLLTSTVEKVVEGYRASSAFRDETKLVSEEIVRIIEPSVPEPGDENNEELLGTLDEILGDIDDDEMIEALRQNPI
ncbi:Structural constituent of ribosome [Dorcoceras hygrometricum]|uniref:Structural constituent of ribosome n=1 Tax=Dorcoceras hygrometricum TaxID=472368 RepID=A0A2Z7CFV2_9LAMI|nr:Structural constituent of ribosome [Dorcoceras hygrometricum]